LVKANSRVLLFNKIRLTDTKYYAKSFLYKDIDFLGLNGTQRMLCSAHTTYRLRKRKASSLLNYNRFLFIFSAPILNFFRQNFSIFSFIGLNNILINPISLIFKYVVFINTIFRKLTLKKKHFMYKFRNIFKSNLSKYFYLLKRKISLFYPKFDNKYLFLKNAKILLKKKRPLISSKKKLLFRKNNYFANKKAYMAQFSVHRRIKESKRKYFREKIKKKFFKLTGMPFPFLLIHYDRPSQALAHKQKPNFDAKYALRNFYLKPKSNKFFNYKYKFKKKKVTHIYKIKKFCYKTKNFKKAELTFLKKQLTC